MCMWYVGYACVCAEWYALSGICMYIPLLSQRCMAWSSCYKQWSHSHCQCEASCIVGWVVERASEWQHGTPLFRRRHTLVHQTFITPHHPQSPLPSCHNYHTFIPSPHLHTITNIITNIITPSLHNTTPLYLG